MFKAPEVTLILVMDVRLLNITHFLGMGNNCGNLIQNLCMHVRVTGQKQLYTFCEAHPSIHTESATSKCLTISVLECGGREDIV